MISLNKHLWLISTTASALDRPTDRSIMVYFSTRSPSFAFFSLSLLGITAELAYCSHELRAFNNTLYRDSIPNRYAYGDHTTSHNSSCQTNYPPDVLPVYKEDAQLLHFALNLEYNEAEYFLWGALGYGLDVIAPKLAHGGPPPYGVRKANLDKLTWGIISEFGFEEIGHLRIIEEKVGFIPRPKLNLSAENFALLIDQAFGHQLEPPFDPYRNSISYMIGSYIVPYMGLTGYVGAIPMLKGYVSKTVTAGLLGVEAGQDAAIREYLYERAHEIVHPYQYTVAEFTNKISSLRNKLGMCGLKDEGIIVPPPLGAEGRSATNVLSANRDSISYSRTPAEILRVLYLTSDEHVPGGFYPQGANGEIATSFIHI